MKTLSITLFVFLLSNTLVATELEWVDEQIQAIKPPRKSVVIADVLDPFVFLKKNRPKEEKKETPLAVVAASAPPKKIPELPKELTSEDFTLSTIINTSAMINGNWYKQNDRIENFIISEIDKQFVILKNQKGDKTIFLSTKTQTLKFKNK